MSHGFLNSKQVKQTPSPSKLAPETELFTTTCQIGSKPRVRHQSSGLRLVLKKNKNLGKRGIRILNIRVYDTGVVL